MFRRIGFVLGLVVPMVAFAVCKDCEPKDKIYVQLGDLFFDANGIWYKNPANQAVELARSIHVDSVGYYVSNNAETWSCPKCGRVNEGKPYGWGCSKCGWPYDGQR